MKRMILCMGELNEFNIYGTIKHEDGKICRGTNEQDKLVSGRKKSCSDTRKSSCHLK